MSHTAKIGGPNLHPETENTKIFIHIEGYGAYNMTKLFEFELCKFELLTSVI